MGFIIVLAAPVFFLSIAIEWWWGWRQARRGQTTAQAYRLDDAISSISLGIMSQLSAVFTRVFRVTIYTLAYEQIALFPNEGFWWSWYGVLIALVLYDLCYYAYHRASHEVAVVPSDDEAPASVVDEQEEEALAQEPEPEADTWVEQMQVRIERLTDEIHLLNDRLDRFEKLPKV